VGQRSIEHLDGIAIACSKREESIIRKGTAPRLHYLLKKMNLVVEAISQLRQRSVPGASSAQFRPQRHLASPYGLPCIAAMAFLNDSHFTSDQRLGLYGAANVRPSLGT